MAHSMAKKYREYVLSYDLDLVGSLRNHRHVVLLSRYFRGSSSTVFDSCCLFYGAAETGAISGYTSLPIID